MKLLFPLVIALLGLGAGVGAGLALKPAPEEHAEAEACDEHAEPGCAAAEPDPFEKPHPKKKPIGELAYVPIEKPFVVPVFDGEEVIAMVVMSLSIEVGIKVEKEIKSLEPRLRDAFLAVMFRHANSGGFDGSFTAGQKIEDLKSALRLSAGDVIGDKDVGDILITEIARQDV